MNYKENTLKRFVKDYSLPIQVYTNDMLLYYIDLYDTVYHTKDKWRMFEDAVNQCGGEDKFISYTNELTNHIVNTIKDTTAYNEFINCDIDTIIPVNDSIEGIKYVKSSNIYTPNNHGKYFVSFDLKKANYQALRGFSKGIVLDTNSYEEFIEQFTDMEYVKQSKYIRQVIFGNLNMNRITRQERFLNEWVLHWLINTGYPKDKIIVFTTDEIIIECQPQMFLGNGACEVIEKSIYNYTGLDVKVEDFKLKYIGNNTYVKEHASKVPTFKGGSAIYFPQAYKAYMNIPLEDKDLLFMYEKQLAKFVKPLKWINMD